jgi:basic membrane protein A and related proteins
MSRIKRTLATSSRISLTIILAATALLGLVYFFKWQSPAPVRAESISVGLIPDLGGIHDQGFNQATYEGLVRAESELGITGVVYTTTSTSDYETNLKQCVFDGNQLCISVGFSMVDATLTVAKKYTTTNFASMDNDFSYLGAYPDNLRGILFSEKEVAYLAGALAGKMTQSNVVGVVGGMAIPPVVRLATGYQNGAQCANPAALVIVNYTDTFIDPDLGAQLAQKMLARNADVIFGAGGSTGTGAVLTATQSGAWGIGVDADQFVTTYGSGTVAGSDKLLTSAMKRLDNAAFNTISDVISGTFTSGTLVETLATNGVGLAPFHQTDAAVPQAVKDQLALVKQGIIDKTIDVDQTCRSSVYLPFISN